MSATYDTGYVIAQAVQERAGISLATITDKTMRYVQRAYYELIVMEPWPWVLKSSPGIINTVDYIDDHITATEGSASATVTTASTTTNLTGYKVYHNDNQKIYRITLHSAYTLTLDATWKEDSVSAEDCTIYKDEYTLAADYVRLWSFRDRTNNTPIAYEGHIWMHAEWDEKTYNSNVVQASVVPGGTKILFEPWLQYASTIEYLYTAQQTDLTFDPKSPAFDVPVIPKYFRFVLEDMAYLKVLQDWEDKPSIQPKIVSTERAIARTLDRMRATYIKQAESFSA